MKRALVGLFATVLFTSLALGQDGINIIPKPESVETKSGQFSLDRTTQIVSRSGDEKALARLLNDHLIATHGLTLKVSSRPSKKSNNIVISDGADKLRLNDG